MKPELYHQLLLLVKSGETIGRALRQLDTNQSRYYEKATKKQKRAITAARREYQRKGFSREWSDADQRVLDLFCGCFDACTPKQLFENDRVRPILTYCVWMNGEYSLRLLVEKLQPILNVRPWVIHTDINRYISEKDPHLKGIAEKILTECKK